MKGKATNQFYIFWEVFLDERIESSWMSKSYGILVFIQFFHIWLLIKSQECLIRLQSNICVWATSNHPSRKNACMQWIQTWLANVQLSQGISWAELNHTLSLLYWKSLWEKFFSWNSIWCSAKISILKRLSTQLFQFENFNDKFNYIWILVNFISVHWLIKIGCDSRVNWVVLNKKKMEKLSRSEQFNKWLPFLNCCLKVIHNVNAMIFERFNFGCHANGQRSQKVSIVPALVLWLSAL